MPRELIELNKGAEASADGVTGLGYTYAAAEAAGGWLL
jgi:hypothetical protein